MDDEPPKTPEENAPEPERPRAHTKGGRRSREAAANSVGGHIGKVIPFRDENGHVRPAPSIGRPIADAWGRGTKNHGNGAGWGGPATHPGQPGRHFKNITPEQRLTGMSPEARANREAAVELAMQTYMDVLGNADYGPLMQMAAADKLLNRIEGTPVTRVAPAGQGQTVEEMRELDPKLLTQEERDNLRSLMERQLAAQGRNRG